MYLVWSLHNLINNNNSLHLYSAFFSTQSALHREGNLLNHHQCAASTWMMRRQPYCARTLTTHQITGGEKTEWWSQLVYIYRWLGGHDGQRPLGKFDLARMPGLHPYSFKRHPGIFNDHRESGPRLNVSSQQYSVPITLLGC